METCVQCGKQVEKFFIIKRQLCEQCYKQNKYQKTKENKKEICSQCNKLEIIGRHIDGEPQCPSCYAKHVCSYCSEEKPLKSKKGQICESCYRKEKRKKVCSYCGELKTIVKRINGKQICSNCCITLTNIKEKCFICKEERPVFYRDMPNEPICKNCYEKSHQHKEICVECGEHTSVKVQLATGPICSSCYYYLHKIEKECTICKKLKYFRDTDNNPICKSCYSNNYQKKAICAECNSLTPAETYIDNKPICKKCYRKHQPKHICSCCGENKPYENRKKQICAKCNRKERLKNDECFNLLVRLRRRLNHAFELYSTTGKTKHADEYGIDYEAIIKRLGPCPGAREDYHIDHIKPLILFNFDDLEQIKIAFAPENHQWLTKEENLSKGDSYET